MADLIGRKIGFEQSISPAMPQAGELTPSAPSTGSQTAAPAPDTGLSALDRLLSRPGLDNLLMQTLKPRGMGAELLRPAVFLDTLQRTRAELRRHGQANPKNRRSTDEAADLLDDELKLQELLSMYRNALFLG